MATNFQSATGFQLPSIDYTLTKPLDMVGAIERGLQLGQDVQGVIANAGTLPDRMAVNQNKLKLQKMQQEGILAGDGNMESTGQTLDSNGNIQTTYKSKAQLDLDRQLAEGRIAIQQGNLSKIPLQLENIRNQIYNRDRGVDLRENADSRAEELQPLKVSKMQGSGGAADPDNNEVGL